MNNRLFAPLASIEICHVGTCLSSKLLVRTCVDYTLHPWPILFLAAAGVRGWWPKGICHVTMRLHACTVLVKARATHLKAASQISSIRYRKQPLAMAQRTCQLVPYILDVFFICSLEVYNLYDKWCILMLELLRCRKEPSPTCRFCCVSPPVSAQNQMVSAFLSDFLRYGEEYIVSVRAGSADRWHLNCKWCGWFVMGRYLCNIAQPCGVLYIIYTWFE